MPRNFKNNFQYRLGDEYYNKFGQSMAGKLLYYDFLSAYHTALVNSENDMHGFGRQTKGDRALRHNLTKQLSLLIMAMSGEEGNKKEKEKKEERIDTVLEIIEKVFDCELERTQIYRDIRRERDEFEFMYVQDELISLWERFS